MLSPYIYVSASIAIVAMLGIPNLFKEDDKDEFISPDKYQLRLSVEVARHGERAPGKSFEGLIDGPGFEVGQKELTKKGAESHYAIG